MNMLRYPQKEERKKGDNMGKFEKVLGRSLIVIVILGVVAALYVWHGLARFIDASEGTTYVQMSDEEKEKFSSIALIPEIKDLCVRYRVRHLSNPRDGKYDRVCVECGYVSQLPESFQEPIEKALKSDEPFSSTDINDVSVKIYTIKEGLPLSKVEDLPPEYREAAKSVTEIYYQVQEYNESKRTFMFWFDYKG